MVPVTRKVLADAETPLSAYRKLADNRPGTFLLESAENGRSWSRWSFIGAGAPSALTVRDGQAVWLGTVPHDAPTGGDPLQALRETLELLATAALPGLPPLSGGMVGFFAYDLVRRLERLPELAVDDLNLPDMLLLLATDLAAVDHHEGTITLIANAVNWNGTDERVDEAYDDAIARLDVMTAALEQPLPVDRRDVHQARAAAPRAAHGARNTARSSSGWSARSSGARRFRWCRRSVSRWTPTPRRSTSTGCFGCPTPARTCICSTCPMAKAERLSRSPAPALRRW